MNKTYSYVAIAAIAAFFIGFLIAGAVTTGHAVEGDKQCSNFFECLFTKQVAEEPVQEEPVQKDIIPEGEELEVESNCEGSKIVVPDHIRTIVSEDKKKVYFYDARYQTKRADREFTYECICRGSGDCDVVSTGNSVWCEGSWANEDYCYNCQWSRVLDE